MNERSDPRQSSPDDDPSGAGGGERPDPVVDRTQDARRRYPAPRWAPDRAPDGYVDPRARAPIAARGDRVTPEELYYGVESPGCSTGRVGPKLLLLLAALALWAVGGLLYFGVLGNDLGFDRGGGDETAAVQEPDRTERQPLSDDGAAGEATEEDQVASASEDQSTAGRDSSGGGAQDGVATFGDGATGSDDGDGSTLTTAASVDGTETTIEPGLSSEISGVLDEDGIVLTGSVASQAELDRTLERLSALAESGSVDYTAVAVDPVSPPVKELALSVPDQIGFSVNSDVIEPGFTRILDRMVALMESDQTISVAVLGHTDSQGIDFENLALSQRRAEAVVRYMTDQGINSFRLEPLGRGSTEPVAPNDTPENRALNRRIEFTMFGFDI